jgi:t-SNARE complex subunit (syntaxin)
MPDLILGALMSIGIAVGAWALMNIMGVDKKITELRQWTSGHENLDKERHDTINEKLHDIYRKLDRDLDRFVAIATTGHEQIKNETKALTERLERLEASMRQAKQEVARRLEKIEQELDKKKA